MKELGTLLKHAMSWSYYNTTIKVMLEQVAITLNNASYPPFQNVEYC